MAQFTKAVAAAEMASVKMAGVKVRARAAGLRGVRVSSADEAVSIRVRGTDLATLAVIGDSLVERLRGVRLAVLDVRHAAAVPVGLLAGATEVGASVIQPDGISVLLVPDRGLNDIKFMQHNRLLRPLAQADV